MGYKIIVSPRTQLEIEDIADYYSQISFSVLNNFYTELENAYTFLKINPYFQTRYKSFKAIPIRKFPYLIFFTIDEKAKIVKILSCFNTFRSTTK